MFAAVLAGRSEVQGLLPRDFVAPDAWRAAAEVASLRPIAAPVLQELAGQSRQLPASLARDRHLEQLAAPGATVVVTGQQVGLFGGPLYTLHKAATAIARARLVQDLTGRPCVPVFWLQSEDHDYAEIAQVAFAGSTGRVQLALPADALPSRVSLAHRTLPNEISGLIDHFTQALAHLPHAAEVVELVRAYYLPGRPIVDAFAGLLAELWRAEGLVIINPRVPAFARLAAPLMQRALHEHDEIAADLRTRAALLADAGCEEQVPTRADASLLFFHPRGITGPRYRLTRRATGFHTPEGAVDTATLLDVLAREPLCFSTSALLRPLVQDTLLPTCAYVGGPAEVSYFAQLPPLYARFGVPMPLIAPRARLRVVDTATLSLLRKLGLEPADLDAARQTLLARVVAHADSSLTANSVRARLLAPLQAELAALEALGLPGVADSTRKTRETCERSFAKLAQGVERAALERDTIACERLDRSILALRPDGVPQERAYGFLALAARAGTAALTSAILQAAQSLDPAVRDVYP